MKNPKLFNLQIPKSPNHQIHDGSSGWDSYADFYDWENAQTLGRRDVAFWRRIVRRERARTLELGCGTGRLLVPFSRAGVPLVGLDRSASMLSHARRRVRRLPRASRPALVRGDIRALPFADSSFGVVLAPYGMLQSLVRDRDLDAALASAARILMPGGLLGVELVPDLPRWAEYGPRLRLSGRGPGGARITLVEAVRQDRRRRLTIFDEQFTAVRGRTRTERTFTLRFRTLGVPDMVRRIERTGLAVEATCGDYRGGPWHEDAEVWVLLARKTQTGARVRLALEC